MKKKRIWSLNELITVDGKTPSQVISLHIWFLLINNNNLLLLSIYYSQDCLEIELTLDKPYKWVAINNQERKIFLISLWKVELY